MYIMTYMYDIIYKSRFKNYIEYKMYKWYKNMLTIQAEYLLNLENYLIKNFF